MVKARIKDLAPGASFNAGPVELVVMEHITDGRTLLAAKTTIGNRPFTVRPFTYNRMEPEPAANNFAFSTLCHDLNTDFLGNLDAAGVIPADKVVESAWDLSDHDGTNRYGYATCKVAMLPEPLVRKYYDAGLLEIDDWEWTITPRAAARAACAASVRTGVCPGTARTTATTAFARLCSWILKSACR